jgi:hypothetical protein
VRERLRAHGVDGPADVLPVDLRHVDLRRARREEHRVRQARVEVDVREGRQAERVAGPDRGAQRGEIALGLRVAALVVRLGVDHQAVRAGGHRLCALRRLALRVRAVDELPRARAQPLHVQRGDQARVELRPRRRAVRGLHEHGLDPGRARLGADRGGVTAAAPRQLPDPHPVALEGGGQRAARYGGRPRGGDRQHDEPDHA